MSLMEKLGQSNKPFATLYEMTNKQVGKYSGSFTENRNLKQRANKSRIKCAKKDKKTHV